MCLGDANSVGPGLTGPFVRVVHPTFYRFQQGSLLSRFVINQVQSADTEGTPLHRLPPFTVSSLDWGSEAVTAHFPSPWFAAGACHLFLSRFPRLSASQDHIWNAWILHLEIAVVSRVCPDVSVTSQSDMWEGSGLAVLTIPTLFSCEVQGLKDQHRVEKKTLA